jgi:hypothetical protein
MAQTKTPPEDQRRFDFGFEGAPDQALRSWVSGVA